MGRFLGRGGGRRTRIAQAVAAALMGTAVVVVPTAASAAVETSFGVEIAGKSASPQKSGNHFVYELTISCDQLGSGSGGEADHCVAPDLTIPLGSDLQALLTGGDLSVADFAVGSLTIDGVDYVEGFEIVDGDLVIHLADIPVGTAGTFEFTITPRNGVTPDGTEWSLLPSASGDNFDPASASAAATGEATASLSASITKSVQGNGFKDLGDEVVYLIRVECQTATTGMIWADELTVTDEIPDEIDFDSAVPAATPSGGTLTWTLSGTDLPAACVEDSPADPKYVELTVTGSVAASASYGQKITNTATVTGTTIDDQTIALKEDDAAITVVDEGTPPDEGVGDFTKSSFGQLRDNDASESSTPSGLEADSHTTYPGNWAGLIEPQIGNVLSGYTPNQATGMTQAGYKMRFVANQENGAGYQHQIVDPVPCLDNVSGQVYSSNPVGDPLCTNVAFHVATVSVWSSTSGGVPAISDGWAPTVRFTDSTSGTLERTSGGDNNGNYALTAADAGKTIAEITFPRDAGLAGPDVRWAVFGYVDDAVGDLSLVKNVAQDTIYYGAGITAITEDTDDADLRVVEAPQVGIEKTLGGHNSAGTGKSTMELDARLFSFNPVDNDLVVTDLLPEGMVVDTVPATATGTITTADADAPATVTSETIEVLDNWQGTGRQLVRIKFRAVTLAPLPSFRLETSVPLTVSYLVEPGTYHNTAQVYFAHPDLLDSCQQSPAYLQDTEPMDFNSNESIYDDVCYSQASLTVPPPSGGASFRTAKTVQGDGDMAPKSYPAIGRVDGDGGSATFGISWKNTGGVKLHGAMLYDIFPAVGDVGVGGTVAGLSRNSEFDATFVGLGTVPTGVSVEYTTETNPCRDEVFPDAENTGCVDDWTATQPTDLTSITGIRLVSSETYEPGEGFAMDILMSTPVIDEGEIAWNSIAGAAITPDDKALTNSPPKVGITSNASTLPLLIDKTLDDSIDPADVKVGDTVTYHLSVTNPDLTPRTLDGTDTLPDGLEFDSIVGAGEPAAPTTGVSQAGQIITWDDVEVPSGQTYTWTVTATVAAGAVGTLTNEFTVPDGKADDPCGDDTVACAEITVAPVTITVAKVVDGSGDQFAPEEFSFELVCTVPPSTTAVVEETFDLADGDDHDVDVPQQASCQLDETEDGGATDVAVTVDGSAYTLGDVFAVADSDIAIEATNTFQAGALIVNKDLSGVGAGLATKKFDFAVECTFEGAPVAGFDPATFELVPDGTSTTLTSDPLGPLPVGAQCEVSETDRGEADATPDPITVDIVEQGTDNTATVTFVNEFSAGTIAVEKVLAGDWAATGALAETDFTIDVTCTYDGNALFTRSVVLRGGERVVIEDGAGHPVELPVGTTCAAVELDSLGASRPAEISDPVTVTSGTPAALQDLTLSVTNTFDAGTLAVAKTVSGVGAALASGSFAFSVDCTFRGQPVAGFPADVVATLPAGATSATSAPVGPLPVGAVCVTTETDAGTADAAAAPVSTTIVANDHGNAASVAIDNAYSAGVVAVTKKLDGAFADREELDDRKFEIAVVCMAGSGADAKRLVDKTLVIRGGETKTVTDKSGADLLLPVGVRCWAKETDDGGADASAVDHDKGDPVEVVAGKPARVQTLRIKVTNTFSTLASVLGNVAENGADPDTAGESDGALPNLGGPALALLVLGGCAIATGGWLVRRGRLRRDGPA